MGGPGRGAARRAGVMGHGGADWRRCGGSSESPARSCSSGRRRSSEGTCRQGCGVGGEPVRPLAAAPPRTTRWRPEAGTKHSRTTSSESGPVERGPGGGWQRQRDARWDQGARNPATTNTGVRWER